MGRPKGDPFEIKPLTMPGERVQAPRKSEHICPTCGSEVDAFATQCPNCGGSLQYSNTGNLTNWTPDQAKPKMPTPNTNIQLADAIQNIKFNSKTNQFFIEASEEGEFDASLSRKKRNPDIELVDRDMWESKEFSPKAMLVPNDSTLIDDKVDKIKHLKDINNTLDSLCIDG